MIYLDNAATTKIHPDVAAAMQPYLSDYHGNPSSIHSLGRQSRRAIDEARTAVGRLLGVSPADIVFTSGGTEANYLGILGTILALPQDRRHIVSSEVEHHAVLHTLEFAENLGASVTLVPPNRDGKVDLDTVLAAVRPDTGLVSIMRVNNELGTMNPVFDMARALKERFPDIVVHSDMVQSLASERLNLPDTQIDLASVSAHKIHGPKGIGALYIRPGTKWKTMMRGGDQELKRRGGTENLPGIVGFGEAARMQYEQLDERLAHIAEVNRRFWSNIRTIDGLTRNSPVDAVPNILNVRFDGVPNDVLLMRLDLAGIAASAGSACTAGALTPSHVLTACGYDRNWINSSARFSFSALTSLMAGEAAAKLIRREVELIHSNR